MLVCTVCFEKNGIINSSLFLFKKEIAYLCEAIEQMSGSDLLGKKPCKIRHFRCFWIYSRNSLSITGGVRDIDYEGR